MILTERVASTISVACTLVMLAVLLSNLFCIAVGVDLRMPPIDLSAMDLP